nr:hypothetical protein [Psychrobacter sp. PraFG1]UNK05192.1 hypothetical protein MN210_14735 [Psychrobacter sp. PraFG1]
MSTPLHSRHKPSRLIGSDKETGLNMLAQTLKNTLTTLGLASVGTAALVGLIIWDASSTTLKHA